MADITSAVDVLLSLGFTEDADSQAAAVENAEAQGMSDSGTYLIHRVLTKGEVVVTFEQNQSPEDLGGLQALVTHPPVAIVASPNGRVACNPDDIELLTSVVSDLA